ncbi:MAG TPA: hypothetical protein VMU84_10615 [Thermoanaerobaculia bacterium]|nr:hypothetical protein [Thermoanaerobaculia bacterium]
MSRHLTAATSLAFPLGFALLIGVPASLLDLGAIALLAKPWAMRPSASAIALLVLAGVVAPIGYFVFGWSYGMGRAVFRVYLVYREAVAQFVINRSDPDDWSRDKPRAMRRVLKIVLMLIGAGDRLQDTVSEGKPRVEIVAAIVDDLLYARLVEPPRNVLIVIAIANVIALGALAYVKGGS